MAVADDDREELVVAEGGDTAPFELFSRTIGWGELVHVGHGGSAAAILSKRMRRRLACVLVGAAFCAACSEPPTKEREQAQGAIAAARAAGAGVYAPEELHAAETALAAYDTAVGQGDYRLALNEAIEARDSAYAAARRAGDEKAAARSEAERLAAAVDASIQAAESRVAGTTAPRPPAAVAARLRASIKTATTAVQKARSLMTNQDYRGAVEVLTPIREALERDLAAPAPPPARRTR